MGREEEIQLAKGLFASTRAVLDYLPPPNLIVDKDWIENPVDLETWLYAPAFMNLGTKRLSHLQLEALVACDDISPQCQFNEYVLEWGKGSTVCSIPLTDLASGETKTYEAWAKDGRSLLLRTWNGKSEELRYSGPVKSMGVKSCSRVTFSNNAVLEISDTHRFLTPFGWKRLNELLPGAEVFASSSNAKRESQCAPAYWRKVANSRFDYHHVSRLCDERLQTVLSNAGGVFPSPNDVQHNTRLISCEDEIRELKLQYTGSKNRSVRLKNAKYLVASLSRVVARHTSPTTGGPSLPVCPPLQTPLVTLRPIDTGLLWLECGGLIASLPEARFALPENESGYPSLLRGKELSDDVSQFFRKSQHNQGHFYTSQQSQATSSSTTIVSIEPIGEHECYDLTMPVTHCYFSDNGILNHNSGKDFIAALMALRQIYRLLCLRDPYAYYGLIPNTGIELCNVAYTKPQAKEIYFKQLVGLLMGSRWFNKHQYRIFAEKIEFPHRIFMYSKAADGDSVEGMNLFFAVMDEASAFKDSQSVKAMNKAEGEKVQSNADGIYRVLRSSSTSRFGLVGKVVMISYPRYIDDFIQTKRKENEKNPHGWTSGPYPTWEVNPRTNRDQFKADYERNPELAAAMYECKPPFAEDSYIKYPKKFIDAIVTGRQIGLENPLDEHGNYSTSFEGIPGRFYAIHVDLALTKDRCALALACQGNPERRLKCPCNAWNLKDAPVCMVCGRPRREWREDLLPTIIFPLVRIFARGGEKNEVDFSAVREDILHIRHCKFNLWSVTYDGWQSQDSIQILDKALGNRRVATKKYAGPKDYKEEPIVGILSVDRTMEAHDTLKEFIYDERAYIMPGSFKNPTDDDATDVMAIAFREWRALKVINGRKCDHPRGGSKDVVDAMAGAALQVSKMPMVTMRQPKLIGWSERR